MTSAWLEFLAGLVAVAVALGMVTAAIELRWMHRHGRLDRMAVREMLLSLSLLPPNAALSLLAVGIWGALYSTAHEHAVARWASTPATGALALLAVDFSYYWEHRTAHRLPWLWRSYHAVHHSSRAYTVATAYRVSFLSQCLAPAFYLPWVLLGFHPLLIAGLQLFAFHWQAWLHTEWIGSMGGLDRWFNTPAAHRVHHSRALEHRDRNLGAITLLWDRCFGTFAQSADKLSYGIHGERAPNSPLAIYLDPWKRGLRRFAGRKRIFRRG